MNDSNAIIITRTFSRLSREMLQEVERADSFAFRARFGALSWDDLLKYDRVFIVSQAGSGKTYECQECQRRLWDEGQAAFYLELAQLATAEVADLLRPDETKRLEQWRISPSSVATFFLDSVDELNLTRGSFRKALTTLARAFQGQLARTRIVITSRPIEIDRCLVAAILPLSSASKQIPTEDEFADAVLNPANTQNKREVQDRNIDVELLPLSPEQIVQFARKQRVSDPDILLADIRRRNALEFAERPQDLIELCSAWRGSQRIESHKEQVTQDIIVKLKPRTQSGRAERTPLSPGRAQEGASRLALAALLTRRLTFRHNVESDADGASSNVLDPSAILQDWTEEERATLLERALFGVANYGRVRFHHRSVMEYLAAQRLLHYLNKGASLSAIKRLLFSKTSQGEQVVRPTMRPIAAWLAIDSESIFNAVCEYDPYVLFNFGDPESLTNSQRRKALEAFVNVYGRGGARGLRIPSVQIRRFASPALATLIPVLWPRVESIEVKALLLDFIGELKLTECSDAAFEVVMVHGASDHLRLSALDALIELRDVRLPVIVQSLLRDRPLWPPRLARASIVRLFPRDICNSDLLLMLGDLTEQNTSSGYLTYYLPERIIDNEELVDLGRLSGGLAELVGDGVKWEYQWPPYRSRRPFLIPALAAACTAQLRQAGLTVELARSISLTLLVASSDFENNDRVAALRTAIAGLSPSNRAILFWAGDTFRQNLHPLTEPWDRFWEADREGPLKINSQIDNVWILEGLANPKLGEAERTILLHLAARSGLGANQTWTERSVTLRRAIGGSAPLEAILNSYDMQNAATGEAVLIDEEHQKSKKLREARRENARAYLIGLRRALLEEADVILGPEKITDTVWELWRAASHASPVGVECGWNRQFFEQHFGHSTTERVREGMLRIWRGHRPLLRSERPDGERDRTLVIWYCGLSAITAEAEDPNWITNISEREAELACRYAAIQLNGLPHWLAGVAETYPNAIDSVIGEELSSELSASGDSAGNTLLLQAIAQASPSIVRLLSSRMLAWLDDERDVAERNTQHSQLRLEHVVDMISRNANTATKHHLRSITLKRLNDGLLSRHAGTWARLLLKVDPEHGVRLLEEDLGQANSVPSVAGMEWIESLFGDRSGHQSVALELPEFTPEILLRLVCIAYHQVQPRDDIEHDGIFTPNARDNAQMARNALLNRLLAARGPAAVSAKLQLAAEPFFQHMRDRVLMLNREQAAQDADGEPFDIASVLNLEQASEVGPRNAEEMFRLMNDRLDDLEDSFLQDTSPREEMSSYRAERMMRRAIARFLKSAERMAYKTDQEAVTGEEKETDIRLLSTASRQVGTIELKVGESWTGPQLYAALSDQLLLRYMQAEHHRAGILLITVASARQWKHPETEQMLDIESLVSFINHRAEMLMAAQGGRLHLAARVLNLRAPIN